jgi:hypothetical protein
MSRSFIFLWNLYDIMGTCKSVTHNLPGLNFIDSEDQCSHSHLDYITDKEESPCVSRNYFKHISHLKIKNLYRLSNLLAYGDMQNFIHERAEQHNNKC